MNKILLLSLFVPSMTACGSGSPVGGTFTVDFPTVADAVATSTIQVFVYPFAAATSCQALFEARETTKMTPAGSVAQTSTTSPCDLKSGSGSLSVPFGSYSFLAVAQGGGCTTGDLLIGCAAQTISDTNSVVSIPLTLETNACAVPTTSCTTLSSFCSKSCK
jgi:hypothetical protein